MLGLSAAGAVALYATEETFCGEKGRYADDLAEMGYPLSRYGAGPYWIEVVQATHEHFRARAVGKPHTEVAGDVWEINDRNELTNLRSVCRAPTDSYRR